MTLSIESDQPVRLQVWDEVLLAFETGPGEHRVSFSAEKGKPVPIRLAYDHYEGSTGRIQIRWSVDGTRFEPIPGEALKHSDRDQRWVDRSLFLSEL